MSETPSTADADTAPDANAAPGSPPDRTGVSMRKPSRWSPAAGRSANATPTPAQIPPPLTIKLVTAAIVVMVLASIARGLLLLGSTPTLQKYVTDVNRKAKKPDKNFDVAHAVHQVREGALIQAAIFGIALLLLAYAMRRVRSASATRWALLIIFVYTGMPFYVIPTSGLPAAVQAAGVTIGVAAIAAVLLIFVPPTSQKYFKACREANRPADGTGPARPGLAGLFGPKRPRGQAPPPRGGGLFGGGARRPAATTTTPSAPKQPAAPKAKAKVRADSDAIAKGAELARSRAKAAGKSRRTSD